MTGWSADDIGATVGTREIRDGERSWSGFSLLSAATLLASSDDGPRRHEDHEVALKKILLAFALLPVESQHAAVLVELRHEQIAVAVDGDAVRCGEDAGAPLFGLGLVGAGAGLGVRAEPADDLAALVEHADLSLELSDDRVITRYDDRRWEQQVLRDDAKQLAVEREMEYAVVGAVARDD